jgi:uncharacterized damage-inducible protein DinB
MNAWRFLILVLAMAVAAGAAPQAPESPKCYAFPERAAMELKEVQQEVVSLAEAMPQDKYTWRPTAGVRSVSEVYLHMAAANFGLTAIAGVPASPGFKFQGYEKSTTDKVQIIDQLNRSFEYAENGIRSLSDADLLKPIRFQQFTSVGDIVLHIVAHAHEHLGQSIAYARMNGVVPPWTAAQQQKQGQLSQSPRPPDN